MTEVVVENLVLLGGKGDSAGEDGGGGRARGASASFDQRTPEADVAHSTQITDEDIPF